MPTFWVRPEDSNHCLMVMVKTETPEQAWLWSRAMETASKPFNGFCQISRPDSPCTIFCEEHWRCAGIEGWELFAFHDVKFDTVLSILLAAQEQAERMRA